MCNCVLMATSNKTVLTWNFFFFISTWSPRVFFANCIGLKKVENLEKLHRTDKKTALS